jgi:hypothetical protein
MPLSHIKLIGNTFENWRGSGVAIRHARNVTIRDNRFGAPLIDDTVARTLRDQPWTDDPDTGVFTHIYIDQVRGVQIDVLPDQAGDRQRQLIVGPDVGGLVSPAVEGGANTSDVTGQPPVQPTP